MSNSSLCRKKKFSPKFSIGTSVFLVWYLRWQLKLPAVEGEKDIFMANVFDVFLYALNCLSWQPEKDIPPKSPFLSFPTLMVLVRNIS